MRGVVPGGEDKRFLRIFLQTIRSGEGGNQSDIRTVEQRILHTDVLRMDADAVTVTEAISASVLENGRVILPLVAGHGYDVELDGWIRS